MQILIAKITSPHGIKGEVKLISYSENSSAVSYTHLTLPTN